MSHNVAYKVKLERNFGTRLNTNIWIQLVALITVDPSQTFFGCISPFVRVLWILITINSLLILFTWSVVLLTIVINFGKGKKSLKYRKPITNRVEFLAYHLKKFKFFFVCSWTYTVDIIWTTLYSIYSPPTEELSKSSPEELPPSESDVISEAFAPHL